MKIKSLFKLVEIRTKVASVIPLFLGILFTIYRYDRFKPYILVLFFISMICIDLATTAINNFMDNKRAIKKEGFNYEEHNAMMRDGISDKSAITAIFILLIFAAITGTILFLMTDWVILLIGLISFIIGICYSSGPLPISRTHLGEIFSGVVMGGFIYFITVYVQIYDNQIIIASINSQIFNLQINFKEVGIIVFTSLPLIFMIANIMLANNICDVEDDTHNRRFTLPYYIGRNLALRLYTGLYLLSYIVILTGVVLKWLPTANLLVLLTIFPVFKNIRIFLKNQDKATTFALAVKNIMMISIVWIISFLIIILINIII